MASLRRAPPPGTLAGRPLIAAVRAAVRAPLRAPLRAVPSAAARPPWRMRAGGGPRRGSGREGRHHKGGAGDAVAAAVSDDGTSASLPRDATPGEAVRAPLRAPVRTPARAAADVAVVIVDHGSRRQASNDMLEQFAEVYQLYTCHEVVEPAHMEIAEPTILQAVGKCVERGARAIVIAPYFLSRGRHIQSDIPALVAEARAEHPSVSIAIADPIGIDQLMVQLIENRVQSAISAEVEH